MKLNKSTYFSLFFLFCFLASFSANTYKSISTLPTKSIFKNSKSIVISSKEEASTNVNDFLFEENETENENDFQAQSFLLPFFIAYFQYEVFQPKFFSAKPLAEKLTNPIYIKVCNFRI
ncbi:MAG TPA: hypothetical protein PKZ75_10135 [Bacteroidia bacterium]|nr:hypothetical protein [Bacteroidia bacterium]